MSDDPRAEPPEQPKTINLPAVPAWAVELATNVRQGFTEVRADLETVKAEGQRTNLRLTRQEVRMDDVETRLANNSERASRVSDGVRGLSSADLDQQAKLAAEIVRNEERDKKIAETHALASNAATKEDVKAIVDSTATKEEVKTLIDAASIAQTAAIVAGVKTFVSKPLVQKIGYAAGVLLLQALTLGTAYLAMKGH